MPDRKRSQHYNSEATRLEVARLLAVGMTAKAAADKVGVGVKAIYNWKKQPEFQELIEDIRQDIHNAAVGKIISRTEEIIDSLFEKVNLSIDPDRMNHSDQVNASRLLLGLSERAMDNAQIKRIKRLEEIIAELTADTSVNASQDN